MRFQFFFLAAIFTSISLVAGDVLQKWTDAASRSSSNVIRLDEKAFDQLIAPERNYTVVGILPLCSVADVQVTLTAMGGQYSCLLCREFDPEFATVAKSWRKAHPESDGVFFAKLDLAEGRSIFIRVLSSRLLGV
jgi:oligosaccharyltransferase complex subunit gamma